MKTALLVALLLFVADVASHSMMTCAVLGGNGQCLGQVRNAQQSLATTNYRFDGSNPCQPEARGAGKVGNNGGSQMATVSSGQQITVQWMARNHAVNNQSPRIVRIMLSPRLQDGQNNDYSMDQFKANVFCQGPFINCGRGANVDTQGDQTPCTVTCTVPNVASGKYTLLWEWNWTQNDGSIYQTCSDINVNGNGNAPAPVPVPGPTPPVGSNCNNPFAVGSGSGLIGQYFRGTNFNQYVTQRTDPRVVFDYGFNAPPGINGLDVNFWTIRWLGLVEPRFSGRYTFYTISDDGCRLWILNRLLINDFIPHGRIQQSGQIDLTAGLRAGIRLEYLEVDQSASINLQWSHQCFGQTDIPTSQLFPTTNIGFDEACIQYEGNGKGLNATYFNQGSNVAVANQLEGPNDSREETVPTGVQPNWRVKWTGFVLPSFTEVYTFYATAAAGVKVTVDGSLIIDNTAKLSAEENNGTIALKSGSAASIEIEYTSNGADAQNDVVLRWSTPKCLQATLVPKNFLFGSWDEVPTGNGSPSSEDDGFNSASALFSALFVAILLLC